MDKFYQFCPFAKFFDDGMMQQKRPCHDMIGTLFNTAMEERAVPKKLLAQAREQRAGSDWAEGPAAGAAAPDGAAGNGGESPGRRGERNSGGGAKGEKGEKGETKRNGVVH